ncbi:hypothetical protein UY3_00688 [Chelonia mydas]|uniref:Uncharacterized protein n=1 Tax=Chelonia mydas TaxID=8469 RepID=M7CLN4_CHEMY|nr:hypothetical protein UY3_00688 [Chelonia mydas]
MQTTMDMLKEPEAETPAVNREVEEEGDSSHPVSQDLFKTPPQSSQPHQLFMDEPDEEAETFGKSRFSVRPRKELLLYSCGACRSNWTYKHTLIVGSAGRSEGKFRRWRSNR